MLAKKLSLIFCLFKTGGWGRAGKIKIVFKTPENEFLFYDKSGGKKNTGKKIASLLGKFVIRSKLGDVLNIQAEVM